MSTLASKAAKISAIFVDEAAVAGSCGGCGAGPSGPCGCTGTFPPGRTPATAVPMVGKRGAGAYGVAVEPMGDAADTKDFCPPTLPYADEKADARYMTYVVGEATIAGGATATVQVQPTQGEFDMFYMQLLAIDDANPQSRQRVSVGRFSVGDCPGDCRTIPIFSDVFEPDSGCCNGRPMRARFTRVAMGGQLEAAITNLNSAGSVRVQLIAKGYCHRGSCAC